MQNSATKTPSLKITLISAQNQSKQYSDSSNYEDDSQNDFDFHQIKQQYNQTFHPSSFSPNHPRKKKHSEVIQNWCASNYQFGQDDTDYRSSYQASPSRRLSREQLKKMEEETQGTNNDDNNTFTMPKRNLSLTNALSSRKLSSSTTDGQFQPRNQFYKNQLNFSESECSCSMSTQTCQCGNFDSARISPIYKNFQNRQFSISSDVSQNSGFSQFGLPQIKVSPFSQQGVNDIQQEQKGKSTDENQDAGSYTIEQNIQNLQFVGVLNPQIQISQDILQQAQRRFGMIKHFKKHPSIRRLQIQYSTFQQKALFDGTAVKNAIEKNKSPTQIKKSPFSPRSRIRSEDDSSSFASTAKLFNTILETDSDLDKIKRKISEGTPKRITEQEDENNQMQEQKKVAPSGPDTPIPPYVLKRHETQDYDEFLQAQLINRRYSQDFLNNQSSSLVQKIEDQSNFDQAKRLIKCSSGMDSITVVKMNKN